MGMLVTRLKTLQCNSSGNSSEYTIHGYQAKQMAYLVGAFG
eukprot:CAMPEP_0182833648 /NCGR_PEP_ID=MMETSP0006_2-20121128/20424_1 /TAXON_ID=97485 /ORGANISM="Prymnesium parvum, Strain Texoma1" /LENGTH=40 /DNA_ID= /DNA_START= /DNA_END= /DNA_ORIENTATION=